LIKKLSMEVAGIEKSNSYLKDKNQGLLDQISDLEHQLHQEKQQIELKAKVKELERVKKEL